MTELIAKVIELGTPAMAVLIVVLLAWNNKHMSEHNVTSKAILEEQKIQTKTLDGMAESLMEHRIASGNGHDGD